MHTDNPVSDRPDAHARRRAAALRVLAEAARIASGQALAWLLRQAAG